MAETKAERGLPNACTDRKSDPYTSRESSQFKNLTMFQHTLGRCPSVLFWLWNKSAFCQASHALLKDQLRYDGSRLEEKVGGQVPVGMLQCEPLVRQE